MTRERNFLFTGKILSSGHNWKWPEKIINDIYRLSFFRSISVVTGSQTFARKLELSFPGHMQKSLKHCFTAAAKKLRKNLSYEKWTLSSVEPAFLVHKLLITIVSTPSTFTSRLQFYTNQQFAKDFFFDL